MVGSDWDGTVGNHGGTVAKKAESKSSGEEERPPVRRGDIFWAGIPETGGSVVRGNRPVLVVQNNVGNRFGQTVIVSPITSSLSRKKYPVNVTLPPKLLPRPSEIRLNQVLTIGKSRLGTVIARAPKEVMDQVDEALRLSLGLPEFER